VKGWKLQDISSICDARCMGDGPLDSDQEVLGITIDSREDVAGKLFIAIEGHSHDGHTFVEDVLSRGAAGALVHRPDARSIQRNRTLLVSDTVEALGKLASAYRNRHACPVLAVCGSNGKTTTVRLLQAALASLEGGVHASVKSFNNNIGVPLTILRSSLINSTNDAQNGALICEVGTNHPGEINTLGAIVRPDIAIITSIGREHLEGFVDLAGVANEELAIASWVKPHGTLIVTGESAELNHAISKLDRSDLRIITVGASAQCDLVVEHTKQTLIEQGFNGDTKLSINTHAKMRSRHSSLARGTLDLHVPMLGAHNAHNGAIAFVAARVLGVAPDRALADLAQAQSAEMRLNVSSHFVGPHRVIIINDAYNANPESMLAAKQVLATLSLRSSDAELGRPDSFARVAILGEMRELGSEALTYHREILSAFASEPSISHTLAIGEVFVHAHAEGRLEKTTAVATIEHAYDAVRSLLSQDTIVLVKASRSMKLERIVKFITTECVT
jgi:UDP-N-acetylmuramoyl-tripeptide--D-alanyl-D-alanine ligase